MQRIKHTLIFINEQTYQFESMYGMVHIDEKWLNENIDERTFLILPDEELPECHRRSKAIRPQDDVSGLGFAVSSERLYGVRPKFPLILHLGAPSAIPSVTLSL
ncbi:hypothetical protein PPTG_24775 [Phytophthora nicotianae INRA-310]|uniref:Uncharacterized protein n=1 Tax=Phytophthora nicotianae (strain INRA-310) TaxID=761204 RepID=W2PAA3_PHYN3|nr:hypothetical protein PPTG_24775 [Phytophthora nicotianae INRA-310]ETM97967.1 hypothetical protein PPTG_24775 [Phytophthora nicotianae INRA-310]